MKKQNRNRPIDTENRLMVARGEGVERLCEKGLRSTNWQLQNCHGDVKYSTGNIVNNIVITMCGARWVMKLLQGTLCKEYDCLANMLKLIQNNFECKL